MLVNLRHDSAREHRVLLVSGVAFLTAIAVLIGLSIAIYNKEFDRGAMITIKADRAGLQLAKFGDVRMNGALIGQVREISQDGEEAEIKVSLERDAVGEIPANVTVEILPTTLFGQKFISFVPPFAPSTTSLAADAVIPASRVETNVELSQVLTRLFPLLRAVRPADLNSTLNALATALDGRGERLGETLDSLGSYLDDIDESLPTLRQDLIALADVADTYDLAAPDLLDVLDNLTVTSRTIIEKRQQLSAFFTNVTGVSDSTSRLLSDNESGLIRVGEVTEPIVRLLATYSPGLPCLLQGGARYAPVLNDAFTGGMINQRLIVGTPQYKPYDEDDRPTYGEVGRGPQCYGLPEFTIPAKKITLDQGSDDDENPPTGPTSLLPGQVQPASRPAPAWTESGFRAGMSSGFAGSEGERLLLNAILADASGRDVDSYGSLGSLLYGPVVRTGVGR